MKRARFLLLLACGLGAAAFAATHTVTLEGMKFQNANLTVKRGDQVVWVNQDVVPHTATAKGVFDSGPIAPGQRWSWTAKKAGPVDYICTYHPGMKATVKVE